MIDSPLMNEEGYFFNGCRKRRFCNFSRPGPSPFDVCFTFPVIIASRVSSSARPLSSLLAACKTRARRPTLVVSSRGASPPHGPVSRPSRASIAAAPARSSVPLGSNARNPAVCEAVTPLRRSVARGGDDRTASSARDRRAARASLFPNHRRASDRPPASPPPIADVPRALPVQRPATKAQNRPSWACPREASTRPRCGPPRAAGSRTRSTGRGTRCSGSRSWAWRAPPSSTTAGRWSRGRSRPPAGSPARGGAPTSLREAPRSEEVNARALL